MSYLMHCFGRLLPAVCSGLAHTRSSTTAFTAMPRVAVVGGGLAGLMCAQELQSAGIAVHVFDMGQRGPGQLLTSCFLLCNLSALLSRQPMQCCVQCCGASPVGA